MFKTWEPPKGLQEVLDHLEVPLDTPVAVFCAISNADLDGALDETVVEGKGLGPLPRAKVVTYLRELFVEAGFSPPALGGTLPPAAAPPPLSQQPAQQLQPAQTPQQTPNTGPELLDESLVPLGEVIDQTCRGHTRAMTFAELGVCRQAFLAASGCHPPEEHVPSGAQLAALRALLVAGRVPYADFAVWGPFGARLSKFKKTDASVFIGGELITKRVEGPGSFECWCSSWDLFAVAMVSLGGARIGTLNAYKAGMIQIMRLFPRMWPVLATTDVVLRSERWGRLREQLETAATFGGGGLDHKMPWDAVIRLSAFGAEGPNANWWKTHFELPCTIAPSPAGAAGMIQQVEGFSSNATSFKQSAAQPPPKPVAPRPPQPPRPPKGTSDFSKEVCKNFNSKSGRCAKDGVPCPSGRRHACEICGQFHRAIDHHPEYQSTSGASKFRQNGNGKTKRSRN